MKRIDILIWKYLMDDRGEYVSSVDMCRELGLSRRQLLTRITKLRYPHVVKDADSVDRLTFFKLDCDEAEAQCCTIQLLSKYYHCPSTTIDEILRSVPMDHSITLDEVCAPEEEFSTKDLVNIMGMMPCIEITRSWSKNRYRRTADV